MKERISITEYANQITRLLPKGILLNTNGDKFNSMVIGWGKVALFATSGGSGIGKTKEKLQPYVKGTTIIDAKLVSDGDDLLEYAGRILGNT